MRTATMVLAGLVAAAWASGCGSPAKRAAVPFHAEGVRLNLKALEDQLAKNNAEGVRAASGGLERALAYLPETVRTQAKTRVEERLALAEQAKAAFEPLHRAIVTGSYDAKQVRAQLDELNKRIDQIEKA